jgi:hypothetical protein
VKAKSLLVNGLVIASSYFSVAQGPSSLVIVQSTPTTLHGVLVVQQIRCDDAGGLYIRTVPSPRFKVEAEPIEKLNSKGESVATYSTSDSPEGLALTDFNVSPEGHVYGIGANRKGSYIVNFDSDGQLKSKEALDGSFSPAHLAAFGGGQYLVSGTQLGTREHPVNHAPFTALLDSDGKVLKQITLQDDKQITSAADKGEKTTDGPNGSPANLAVACGAVTAGRDGNVYLMRRTDPALVYVISAGGEVVRKMSIPPPEPGMLPESIQSAHEGIVLSFTDEKNVGILVADPQTGERRAVYSSPPEVGVAFGCADAADRFLFLGSQKSQLVMNTVEPAH